MLLTSGGTYREMAGALGISEATLSVHVDRLYLRLGVHDRAQAVEVATARGLIDGGPETSAQEEGDPEPITNIRD
jgi:DNA-binding NarL/FixJ family response regulator